MERVICIDDSLPDDGFGWRGERPVKGEIYTVTRRELCLITKKWAVWLFEIHLDGIHPISGREYAYHADRFAPIRDTSIEIFRAIDRKAFDKAGVDA